MTSTDDDLENELTIPTPPEGFVADPETGILYLCMDDWESVGFIPTAQAIAEAEAREGKSYVGPLPTPTEAEILQKRLDDMNEVLEQLVLEQLMNAMMRDLEGL